MEINLRFSSKEEEQQLIFEVIPNGILTEDTLKNIQQLIKSLHFLESELNLDEKQIKRRALDEKINALRDQGIGIDSVVKRLDLMGNIEEAFYKKDFDEMKRLIEQAQQIQGFNIDDILVYDPSEIESIYPQEQNKEDHFDNLDGNLLGNEQQSVEDAAPSFEDMIAWDDSEQGVEGAAPSFEDMIAWGDGEQSVEDADLWGDEQDHIEEDQAYDYRPLPKQTLLQWAVLYGTGEFVSYLVQKGNAQVNYKGIIGKRPYDRLLEYFFVKDTPQKINVLQDGKTNVYQILFNYRVISDEEYMSQPFFKHLEAIEFILKKEVGYQYSDLKDRYEIIEKIDAHEGFNSIKEDLSDYLLSNWSFIFKLALNDYQTNSDQTIVGDKIINFFKVIVRKSKSIDVLFKVLDCEWRWINKFKRDCVKAYFLEAPFIEMDEKSLTKSIALGLNNPESGFFVWLLKNNRDEKVLDHVIDSMTDYSLVSDFGDIIVQRLFERKLLNHPFLNNRDALEKFKSKVIDSEDLKLIETFEIHDYESSSEGKTVLMMKLEQNQLPFYYSSLGFDRHTNPSGQTLLMIAIKNQNLKIVKDILDELKIIECDNPFDAALLDMTPIYEKDCEGRSLVDYALELEEGEKKNTLIRLLYLRGVFPFVKALPYLEKWESSSLKPVKPDWSLFAQMHLEHMIEKSSYGGGYLGLNLMFLAEELSSFGKKELAKKYENAASLCFDIEKTNSIKQLPQKVVVTLGLLKVGESFLIPGGWSGLPGSSAHALLYEVVKTSDDTYAFSLFNSGAGLELAHPSKIEGDKELYQFELRIDSIKLEDMCSTSLLEKLFFLRKKKNDTYPHLAKPEDVYHRILPAIMTNGRGRLVSLEAPFSTPQRSGSCALSVCFAHLQKELAHEFKTFRRVLKEKTLESFSKQVTNPEEKFLIQEALPNYARSVLKGRGDYAKALQLIEKCQNILIKEGIKKIEIPEKIRLRESYVHSPLEDLNFKAEVTPLFPLIKEDLTLKEKIEFLNSWKISSLKNDVFQFLFAVERSILSSETLIGLDGELFLPLIALAQKYTAVLDAPTARNTLTFSWLQIAAFEAASSKYPFLKKFRPVNRFLKTMEKNGLYLLKDKELDRKNQEAIAYLKADKPKLFGYLESFQSNELRLSSDLCVEESAFLDEEPKLLEAVKKNRADYAKQAKLNQMYQREDPPIEWFKQACLIEDIEGNFLKEPFLSLKKISLFSFGLKSFSIKYLYNGSKITILGGLHDKDLIDDYITRNNKTLVDYLSFKTPSQEAMVSSQLPKTEENQELYRLIHLFSCPDITNRLSFIINGMKNSMFKQSDGKKLFQAYAFCVKGGLAKEIQESSFLKEELKNFLNEGFRFFTRDPVDFDNALFFIRLSCDFARYFEKELLLDKESILTEWLKNSSDMNHSTLILIHKALLLELKEEALTEEDVYTLLAADLLSVEFSSKVTQDVSLEFKRVRALKEGDIRRFFEKNQKVNSLLNRLRQIFQKTEKQVHFEGEYPHFKGVEEHFEFNKPSYWTPFGYPSSISDSFYGESINLAFKLGSYFKIEHSKLGVFVKAEYSRNLYRNIKGVFCPSFNDLDIRQDYYNRLSVLFGHQEICRTQIPGNVELYTDPKTGEECYSIDEQGLKNLKLNEYEEDLNQVEKWLPLVSQVVPLERTFLFKSVWIFPDLLIQGKPLVLERKGDDFFHKDLGILQLTQDGGLLFKNEFNRKRTLFADASFFSANNFYREKASSNVLEPKEVFIFEEGVLLNDEERIFLISYYVVKGDWENAIDLYNGWHPSKELSQEAVLRILTLLEIRNWAFSGIPPEQEAILLKMASKLALKEFKLDLSILNNYFQVKGNVPQKYLVTSDELFYLLKTLERKKMLNLLLENSLTFYKTGVWRETTLDLESNFLDSFSFKVKVVSNNFKLEKEYDKYYQNLRNKNLREKIKDEIRFLHNPLIVGASDKEYLKLQNNIFLVSNYFSYKGEGVSDEQLSEFFGPDPIGKRRVILSKPNPLRVKEVKKVFRWEGEISFKEKVDSVDVLRQKLDELRNKLPETPHAREEVLLKRYAKIEAPLTIDELVIAFLQLDAQTLGERTYLNEEELKTLQETIVEFLQASTPFAKNYNLSPATIPHLVFEYAMQFSIREKNVAMIERLSSDETLFQQLVMGGGKTKVLLPLLALFKADGNRLVVIVVPEALLETNLQDLSRTSYSTFKQKGTYFEWSLGTPTDEAYLEQRLEELESVIKKRGYLVTTPTDIHHLILTYTTLFNEKKTKSVGQIEKIFKLFQTKGHGIIDEFHIVAAPRKEVRCSLGQKKQLDPEDVAFVKKIYETMSEKKLVPFETKTHLLKHHLLSQEEFKSLTEELSKTLPSSPLLKKQVNSLLKSTLYNKKYGPSEVNKERFYCIPYSDEKTPKEGSEFENPFATLNYSFQYYMSKGIKEGMARVWLENLKKTIREEMEESDCDFFETKTASHMIQKIKGFSSDMRLEAFQRAVNESIPALLSFVETQVAPQIGFFEEVYLSNAPRLFSFFSKISALSATPYNHKTYPETMQLFFDENDLKLMEKKVVDVQGNSKVIVLKEKTIAKIFEKVSLKENNVRAFIDVGAFFENKKNRDVASELLEYFKTVAPEIGGVLYFEGDSLTVEGDGASQDLFTYYDRAHTTGIDILQKGHAKALVFIGQLTLKSDLIQAIGRMRGVVSMNQEILPVMDESEAFKIRQDGKIPTFNEVLEHSKRLEEEESLEDISQSVIQNEENVSIQEEMKRLFPLNENEKQEAFEDLRSGELFIRKVKDFLSEEGDLSRLKIEVVTEQIMQTEQKITQQVELKMESAYTNVKTQKDFGEILTFNWDEIQGWDDLKVDLVQKVAEKEMGIKKPIFSKELYFSPLVENPFAKVKASPFTQYGETPYHVLAMRDSGGRLKFLILSLNDTAQLIKKPLKESMIFSGLTGNLVKGDEHYFKEEERPLFLEILSQTRFLSGSLYDVLKPKELALFKKWFQSEGVEERMKLLPYILNKEALKVYLNRLKLY